MRVSETHSSQASLQGATTENVELFHKMRVVVLSKSRFYEIVFRSRHWRRSSSAAAIRTALFAFPTSSPKLTRKLISLCGRLCKIIIIKVHDQSFFSSFLFQRQRSVNYRDDNVARWQNLIPSFPWIAPGWRARGCGGAIQGKEGITFCSVA